MARRPPVVIAAAQLEEQCRALGCAVPETVLPRLAVYLEMLMRWNAAMNLVGARSWQEALHGLAADSFHLACFLESLDLPSHPHTWDLGAGAGLPGLPLRMVWEKGEYVLVEAREKRALFLAHALAHLRLPRTTAFHGRAEDFFQRAPHAAHLVVSRAFLPWPRVLELIQGHTIPGGRVIFLALTPPPDDLPQGWAAEAARRYTARGDVRWFWALRHSH